MVPRVWHRKSEVESCFKRFLHFPTPGIEDTLFKLNAPSTVTMFNAALNAARDLVAQRRWFRYSVYCILDIFVPGSIIIIYHYISLSFIIIIIMIIFTHVYIYLSYILVVSSKLGFLLFCSLFFERCCLGSSEWVMEMLGPSPRSARWRQRMYRWITPNGGEK